MGRTCKGVCDTLKAEPVPNGARYELGHKRCSFCCMFLSVPDIRCPCCKAVLRTRPRGRREAVP